METDEQGPDIKQLKAQSLGRRIKREVRMSEGEYGRGQMSVIDEVGNFGGSAKIVTRSMRSGQGAAEGAGAPPNCTQDNLP